MSLNRTWILFLCLLFSGCPSALSQVSGIINLYTKVTAIDYLCSSITVASPTGFAAGDKVLLIQMQGASIETTNSAAFGDVTAIADAGNYEFGTIDHFIGNAVYFEKTISRTYSPATGSVQMVSVPQYNDLSIDGELTAKAWDGTTGGVLVFEASGTVTLNANINVSEKGFRGGKKSPDGGDCNSSSSAIYYYTYPSVQAGQKGEGIAAYVVGRESGRAKNSIGGGGGNSHNTGGGGGGNYGAGGRGGDKKATGCSIGANPYGLGSIGLNTIYYSNNLKKIFLGGGGGGGHVNNSTSFDAGNGGGIVIIKATTLNANGYAIKSNGGSVNTNFNNPAFDDNGDGNSGGGAGGTILLSVDSYTAATTLEANGGKGGNTGYENFNFGPGGGGGGGVAWLSSSVSSTLVNASLTGGASGISGLGGGFGSGGSWNATNGANGALLNALALPQSTTVSSCALPVELLSFQVKATSKYQVEVSWTTAIEIDNAYFTLEKSTDGIHFTPVARVQGMENRKQIQQYTYTDEVSAYDMLYYRLSQTDINGSSATLGIRSVQQVFTQLVEGVYPNPFQDKLTLQMKGNDQSGLPIVTFVKAMGDVMAAVVEQEGDLYFINTSSLSPGMYSLILQWSDHYEVIKVIKS